MDQFQQYIAETYAGKREGKKKKMHQPLLAFTAPRTSPESFVKMQIQKPMSCRRVLSRTSPQVSERIIYVQSVLANHLAPLCKGDAKSRSRVTAARQSFMLSANLEEHSGSDSNETSEETTATEESRSN